MTLGMVQALLIGDHLAIDESLCGLTTGPMTVHTTWANSLANATVLLSQRPFDIVLLSLNDDSDEQISAISFLRAQASTFPIIIVSQSDDPDFVLQAVHHGAQDVMSASSACSRTLQRAILTSIERKRLEQYRIRHAHRDQLTGLANQLLLEERFERAMARADRHATLIALVAIDLDQPGQLTEMHGHHHLGQLMPLIGERLMGEIRETDTLARTREVGFTWLVEGLASISDISVLVDRLPGLLSDRFKVGVREVQITASAGVAVCPFHGRDFITLHKMAEAAMLDVATLSGDGLLMLPLPTTIERGPSPISV